MVLLPTNIKFTNQPHWITEGGDVKFLYQLISLEGSTSLAIGSFPKRAQKAWERLFAESSKLDIGLTFFTPTKGEMLRSGYTFMDTFINSIPSFVLAFPFTALDADSAVSKSSFPDLITAFMITIFIKEALQGEHSHHF